MVAQPLRSWVRTPGLVWVLPSSLLRQGEHRGPKRIYDVDDGHDAAHGLPTYRTEVGHHRGVDGG